MPLSSFLAASIGIVFFLIITIILYRKFGIKNDIIQIPYRTGIYVKRFPKFPKEFVRTIDGSEISILTEEETVLPREIKGIFSTHYERYIIHPQESTFGLAFKDGNAARRLMGLIIKLLHLTVLSGFMHRNRPVFEIILYIAFGGLLGAVITMLGYPHIISIKP